MKVLMPVLFLLFFSCASRLVIPDSVKTPVAQTELEKSKIAEGRQMHDRGFFDKALKLYREALDINPDNVTALYETALTYFHMGENEKSLRCALKGMSYKSDLLAEFYMMAGNNLDIMGKPQKAIGVFKKALKIDPEQSLFYYNLAITYFGLKDYGQATRYFIEAIKRNPHHASSHMGLAEIYIARNKQIEALLLLSRFLTLEPKSQRSLTALQKLDYVMNLGVTAADDNKTVNINIFNQGNQNSSRFATLEMFYKLNRASRYMDKNKGKPEIELRVLDFSRMLPFMSKDKLRETDSFLERYLISYFSDLRDAGLVEPFVYYIHQSVNDKTIQDWLRENWPKVREFETWNEKYKAGL